MAVHFTTSSAYSQATGVHGDPLSGCPELLLEILGPERIRSIRTPNRNADANYTGYVYRDDLEKYKELRISSSTFSSTFVFSCKNEGILGISKENQAGDLNFSYRDGYDTGLPVAMETIHYVTMKNDSALEELLRKLFAHPRQSVEIIMKDNQVFENSFVTLQLV